MRHEKPSKFDIAEAEKIASSELFKVFGIKATATPQTLLPIDGVDAIALTVPPKVHEAMRVKATASAILHARLGNEAARVRLREAIERAFSSLGGNLTRHEAPEVEKNVNGIGKWEPRIRALLYNEIGFRVRDALRESGAVSARKAAVIAYRVVKDLKLLHLGKH